MACRNLPGTDRGVRAITVNRPDRLNALDQGQAYEMQAFALCLASTDLREGTRAFLERRKPVFCGR